MTKKAPPYSGYGWCDYLAERGIVRAIRSSAGWLSAAGTLPWRDTLGQSLFNVIILHVVIFWIASTSYARVRSRLHGRQNQMFGRE